MAIGNPLLATWDITGDLRIFEYVAGSFTLLGLRSGMDQSPDATGIAAGASLIPTLQWIGDDAAVLSVRSESGELIHIDQTDRFGAAVGSTEVIDQGTIANSGNFISADFGDHSGHLVLRAVVGSGSLRGWYVTGNPAGSPDSGGVSYIQDLANPIGIAAPADGSVMMVYNESTVRQYARSNGTTWPPTWSSSYQTISFDIPASKIVFDKGVRAGGALGALVANIDMQTVMSYSYDGAAWSPVHTLALPAGDPVHIVMSPDGRMVAVSVLNTGVYTTRIFRRLGGYYTKRGDDITGFGAALAFSEDGMLLVDIAARRLFLRNVDETFTEAAGTPMSSVPTDQSYAVFSRGLTVETPVAVIFDAGLAAMAQGSVDFGNLKLTLLTDSAVFDAAEADLGLLIDGLQDVGGMWPEGGIDMPDVVATDAGTHFVYTHAPLSRVILGSTGLSARYGLIYDATNETPLVWLDFITDREVPTSRELVISFPDGEFLRFEK